MENKDFSAQYFLTNLSHEIRTPLNGIVGYTQLLLNTKLDSVQQMYINSMNHCCIQLVELVNDILDFSKLTTGKAQVNNEYFSVSEIIEEINSILGYKITEKRQKLNFIVEENVPKFIISDKHKILQVLINLISNSNKFTDIDGRIIVSFYMEDEKIGCSVEDTGIGILPENQKKLFNPFFQVNETLTKNGSGLGLAISKKIIELLEGEIKVQSRIGEGSIFSFNFKFENYGTEPHIIEKNKDILHDQYVLVVDDNVDNRLFLSELFFEYSANPVICSSAKEALRLVSGKRYKFSIAVLDICMPEMSGKELAKNIKQILPELPIIALSSLDQPIERRYFEKIIQKPINKLKLLDSIIQVLNKNDTSHFKLNETNNENKNKKILIAEDVRYNSDMLNKMLNNMGFLNIDIANDGEEAIDMLKKGFYGLLILDLKMPKFDGFQVAEFIKTMNIKIQIVVITASVSETDKERCKQLGINYFLLKPFNMTHLKNVIEKINI